MRTLGIATPEELRQADHKALIAWEFESVLLHRRVFCEPEFY